MSERHLLKMTVNGMTHDVVIPARKLLSDVLRDDLGLTGTHVGCEHGVCGACTVLVDGKPVRSCLIFAVQMAGHAIETIESVAKDGQMSPLQQALGAEHGLQCGFCTPGIIMTFEALLRETHDLTETDIRRYLAGNLCRCTGYDGIVSAILKTATAMRETQ